MEWLSNANVIASLLLALFGIGGYLYGFTIYLKQKAATSQDTPSRSPEPKPTTQKTVSYRPLSWMEWIEIFAQGFVDTADFIIDLIPGLEEEKNKPVITKVGFCAIIFAFGIFMGEMVIGFTIGIFLSLMGVVTPTGIAVGLTTVLLFTLISLIYIYHVGLRVELTRLEEYR